MATLGRLHAADEHMIANAARMAQHADATGWPEYLNRLRTAAGFTRK